MGLFSMFKGSEPQNEPMTAHFALACALIYSSAADGELDPEEVGQLLAIMGGESSGRGVGFAGDARQVIDRALKYVRRVRPDQFAGEAAPVLSEAQKLGILANVLDSMFSDGTPEPEEQQFFGTLMQAWGIGEDRVKPIFDVITFKYDRRLFVDPNHPLNQPGARVTFG